MTRWAPLPLAPPPYPAEALHSWLHRVAAIYSMKPRQLLHALGVQAFAGPIFTYPKGTVQATLGPRDLKHLAHLARCDVSRLGLTSTELSEWLLVRDDWLIICPRCIRANLISGTPPCERAVWRLATRSFCPRHRTPLIQLRTLPADTAECDRLVPGLSEIERVVAEQILDFERDIARAYRGIAPPTLQQTLTAAEFLQVLNSGGRASYKRE